MVPKEPGTDLAEWTRVLLRPAFRQLYWDGILYRGSWWTWNVLAAVCCIALEHSLSYSALRTEEYQQTAIGTDTLHRTLRCPTLPGLLKFKKCLVLTNSRQGICFAESCGCSSAGLGKMQSRDFLGYTGCRVICEEEHARVFTLNDSFHGTLQTLLPWSLVCATTIEILTSVLTCLKIGAQTS